MNISGITLGSFIIQPKYRNPQDNPPTNCHESRVSFNDNHGIFQGICQSCMGNPRNTKKSKITFLQLFSPPLIHKKFRPCWSLMKLPCWLLFDGKRHGGPSSVRLQFGGGTVRAVLGFRFRQFLWDFNLEGRFRRFRFLFRFLERRCQRFLFPVPVRFLSQPEKERHMRGGRWTDNITVFVANCVWLTASLLILLQVHGTFISGCLLGEAHRVLI